MSYARATCGGFTEVVEDLFVLGGERNAIARAVFPPQKKCWVRGSSGNLAQRCSRVAGERDNHAPARLQR